MLDVEQGSFQPEQQESTVEDLREEIDHLAAKLAEFLRLRSQELGAESEPSELIAQTDDKSLALYVDRFDFFVNQKGNHLGMSPNFEVLQQYAVIKDPNFRELATKVLGTPDFVQQTVPQQMDLDDASERAERLDELESKFGINILQIISIILEEYESSFAWEIEKTYLKQNIRYILESLKDDLLVAWERVYNAEE